METKTVKSEDIKCNCGWCGGKFEIIIGLNGYFCPKCENRIVIALPKKRRKYVSL